MGLCSSNRNNHAKHVAKEQRQRTLEEKRLRKVLSSLLLKWKKNKRKNGHKTGDFLQTLERDLFVLFKPSLDDERQQKTIDIVQLLYGVVAESRALETFVSWATGNPRQVKNLTQKLKKALDNDQFRSKILELTDLFAVVSFVAQQAKSTAIQSLGRIREEASGKHNQAVTDVVDLSTNVVLQGLKRIQFAVNGTNTTFKDIQQILCKYKATLDMLLLNKATSTHDNKKDAVGSESSLSPIQLLGLMAALVLGHSFISNSQIPLQKIDVLRHRIESVRGQPQSGSLATVNHS